MNCFPNFSSDPSQVLILQYLIPTASASPLQSLPNFPWLTETPLQDNPHHVLHLFPNFFLPYSTTRHNHWIYQTICQVKPMKFVINLYTNHNTLLVKHATYQIAESLRAASLSKLDNRVNSNSIFNTKCPEFSTKW